MPFLNNAIKEVSVSKSEKAVLWYYIMYVKAVRSMSIHLSSSKGGRNSIVKKFENFSEHNLKSFA